MTTPELFANRVQVGLLHSNPTVCMLQGMCYELCTMASGEILSILGIARYR